MKFHQSFILPVFSRPFSFVEIVGEHVRYVVDNNQQWRLPIRDVTPDMEIKGFWGTLFGYGALRFNCGGRTYEAIRLQNARALRRTIDRIQNTHSTTGDRAPANADSPQTVEAAVPAAPPRKAPVIQRDPDFAARLQKEKKPLPDAPVFEPRFFSNEDRQRFERFQEDSQHGDHWYFRYETTLPYDYRHVWETLLRTEYFHYWFFGWPPSGNDKKEIEPLPPRFGCGSAFHAGGREGFGWIIDAEPFRKLTFRFHQNYFDLTLKDLGPLKTGVEFKVYGFFELPKNSFWRSVVRLTMNSKNDPWGENATAENSGDVQALRRRLIYLDHLCGDLLDYGEPLGWSGDSLLYWYDWISAPGTLHLFNDRSGTSPLQVSRKVPAGKVAYVVPHSMKNDPSKDEAYFIENYYIENSSAGTILELRKQHGDPVEPGDRIFLVQFDGTSRTAEATATWHADFEAKRERAASAFPSEQGAHDAPVQPEDPPPLTAEEQSVKIIRDYYDLFFSAKAKRDRAEMSYLLTRLKRERDEHRRAAMRSDTPAASERFEFRDAPDDAKWTEAQLSAMQRYEMQPPFTKEELQMRCQIRLGLASEDMKQQVWSDYETLLPLAS